MQTDESLIEQLPLISCVLIAGSQPAFTLQSADYFRRQDYPERELVLIDDNMVDLSPKFADDAGIRYLRLPPGLSEEQKENYGYEQARGDLIAKWDPHDWQGRERLSFQAAPILTGSAEATALATSELLDLKTGFFWSCSAKIHSKMFALGGNPQTLMFRAEAWRRRSHTRFWDVLDEPQAPRLVTVPNENSYVAVLREHYVSVLAADEKPGCAGWRVREKPVPPKPDVAFFERHRHALEPPSAAPRPSGVSHGEADAQATPARQPLVSCIMPTAGRRAFVPHAIRYFLNQDYPERELIVVDDGPDPVSDIIPVDPRIRYVRIGEKLSLGAKRNFACEQARGEVIMHWDDDDWMASWRISYQVHHLLAENADVCGVDRMYFLAPERERAWVYIFPQEARPWVAGGSLCYTKATWRQDTFADVTIGEDNQFIQSESRKKIVVLDDSRFYVALVHSMNTSPKLTDDARYQDRPVTELQKFMGADWNVYVPRVAKQPKPEPAEVAIEVDSNRLGSAFFVARHSDLALPEYTTFNHDRALPRMRRWELPFALFSAVLEPTMSILDCTIDPVNFEGRIKQLYPHVLYRHVKVFCDGKFSLPWGVPDNAFDRVFCINTLERLPADLRQPLIEELSRKMKSGGRLILVSDCHFDRHESNGSQGSFDDWSAACATAGLYPAVEGQPPALPAEGDSWAYRNLPPQRHGTIAGVFTKGKASPVAVRRVVLALLTWNTCDVSVDSVRAYVKEARMLLRLGVEAAICVCDNGSTDGTASALRKLNNEIELEHRFIWNRENRGSSIGRNQIIDYALEWRADYVLFMDGDIEIVPFSSFVMMRYLDDAGHRVGCLGPDSAGYTSARSAAAPCLYSLSELRVETTERVAWTQYGMFRCAMFREGIRFDESGPFAGPGWGCEDDDLVYQMISRNFLSQRFLGMTYLHRAMQSSVRLLQDAGADVNALFEQRRQYVIGKWESDARIGRGPLEVLRGVAIRFPHRPPVEPRWKRLIGVIQQSLRELYREEHYYTKRYAQFERGFWSHIPQWLEEAGARSKPSRVLDVGCAYGTLAALCSRLFDCQVECADVVPFLTPEVAQVYGLTVHFPLNVETDPLPGGPFDIVLLTETMEHFNFHPVPTLRKIGEALGEEGRIFLTTPDAATWGRVTQYYASLDDVPWPPKRHPDQWVDAHIWQYTRAELMNVIEAAGLAVVREAMSSNDSATHFNLELRKR